jgi:phage FluMu protein Com
MLIRYDIIESSRQMEKMMGAITCGITFDACSIDELKKKFADFQESERFERGNGSYSGHLGQVNGLKILSTTFTDGNKAEDYLSSVAQKYGPAIAVKVGDFTKIFPHSTTEKKEVEKMKELESKIQNWEKDLILKVKSAKSLYKSCVKCGSKISVKHIKSMDCPVCSSLEFLETPTEKKTYQNLSEKFKVQKEKVKNLEKLYNSKNKDKKPYWSILGVCPS